jgi:hypothetical protein
VPDLVGVWPVNISSFESASYEKVSGLAHLDVSKQLTSIVNRPGHGMSAVKQSGGALAVRPYVKNGMPPERHPV